MWRLILIDLEMVNLLNDMILSTIQKSLSSNSFWWAHDLRFSLFALYFVSFQVKFDYNCWLSKIWKFRWLLVECKHFTIFHLYCYNILFSYETILLNYQPFLLSTNSGKFVSFLYKKVVCIKDVRRIYICDFWRVCRLMKKLIIRRSEQARQVKLVKMNV